MIDVARLLESEPKAICFRNFGGKGEQLVGNVMATRKRLALAFDISERDLLAELKQRLTKPIAPVEVASADAPVHQVVWEGKGLDLARLPIHLQHSLDGAPYISSSLDFSTEPGTGRTNVGCRRIMPLGRAIASVDMNAPSDFRAAFLKSLEAKRPMPAAFAIGSHPADFVGSKILLPASDELALIGGVRGSAVPIVCCRTIDQFVAADAEIVLEGLIDAAGYVESEGPYGEYLGYHGRLKRNPLFRIAAITMRKDAVFQTVTIGEKALATTDTAQLERNPRPGRPWRQPCASRLPSTQRPGPAVFNARFSVRRRYAGDPDAHPAFCAHHAVSGRGPRSLRIIVTVNLSIGMYTPPLGLNILAAHSLFGVSMGDLF